MESKESPRFVFGSNTFVLGHKESPVDFDDLRVMNEYDPEEDK